MSVGLQGLCYGRAVPLLAQMCCFRMAEASYKQGPSLFVFGELPICTASFQCAKGGSPQHLWPVAR